MPTRPALLAVLVAGVGAGVVSFPSAIRIDEQADWRAVSQGFRRAGRPGVLAATPEALVHFHEVSGGIEAVELSLSAESHEASVEVRRGERALFHALAVGADPIRVTVSVPTPAGDVDIALWTANGGGRVLLHEVWLRRGEAGGWRRLVPLLCGLAALFALRRERPWWAAAFSVGAVALSALALASAVDPVALLPLRPGTHVRLVAAALAVAAAAGVAGAETRAVAPLSVIAVAVVLHAPTLRYGLVYDDFLWTRAWTLGEVASTFVGSEDPTGVSNEYYRPWASTSHALDYALWGFRPAAFHAVNVALIVATGILAWALFRRLGVSPRAALAGALVWIVHPMSASAVAWMSQRTDSILACLYLATLVALVARPFGPRALAGTASLGVLTFGAKELAVTLPLAALLLVWSLPPDEDRRRRWLAVRLLFLVALLYAAFWVSLFPYKLVGRLGANGGWGAFDPHSLEHWLRLVPGLYGALLLPTGYYDWRVTHLPDWSVGYLASVVAVLAVLAWLALRPGDASLRRLGLVALAAPLLLVTPLLGISGVDLYRGGLMVALGAGALAGVVLHRLGERHRWLPAAAAAIAIFALAPISRDAAAAWGPGGFYRVMTQRDLRHMSAWLASLRPHARDFFWTQVHHDSHMTRRR